MSTLSQLAVPFVYGLIIFLGYPSQWLLMHLEPEPLTKNQLITINVTLVLIFITYTKSVFVDPGTISKDWAEKISGSEKVELSEKEREAVAKSRKWCRKCDAAKPPRAHHCKECKRYAECRDSLGILCLLVYYVLTFSDAYLRWITIAHGPQTAYHTPPFLISSAFSFMQPLASVSLSPSSSAVCFICGTTATYHPTWVHRSSNLRTSSPHSL